MRLARLSPALLAAALTACSVQPEVLNSELIRTRFGSYGVDVLQQSPTLRRSSLYSLEPVGKVCRTYAVVQFVAAGDPDIAAVHDDVVAGGSLGETFAAAGWTLEKRTVHVGPVAIDGDDYEILDLMHLDGPQELAMHVYELYLERRRHTLHYATIVELHHPAYQTVADLGQRYGSASEESGFASRLQQFVALVHSE